MNEYRDNWSRRRLTPATDGGETVGPPLSSFEPDSRSCNPFAEVRVTLQSGWAYLRLPQNSPSVHPHAYLHGYKLVENTKGNAGWIPRDIYINKGIR